MRHLKFPLLVIFMLFLGSLAGVSAQDGRINVVHHFGNDVLYCNQTDGCKLTDDHYGTLWTVPQATITQTLETACSSGQNQNIDAGKGTYGEFVIVAQCPNLLYLVGPDEWGKTNTMPFDTSYQPVSAAGAPAAPAPVIVVTDFCSVDLAANGFSSVDGIHHSEGFDIWTMDAYQQIVTYVGWSASNPPGYPACNI